MSVRDDLQVAVPATRDLRAAPSATKFRKIDDVIGRVLGVDPEQVCTVTISKPGNVSVRAEQSRRSQQSKVLALVVESGEHGPHFEGSLEAAARYVGPGRKRAVVVLAESSAGLNDWEVRAVIEHEHGLLYRKILAEWPRAIRRGPAETKRMGPLAASVVPLTIDASTGRMARLAIATSPAVLFVGPPGTGKNRLLNEILEQIRSDPDSFGFTRAHDVVIEPAEEGWTTRDLVGGETVDENGMLRFRPGRVLDAIANDRWLVLDEANRADLDRIFGGLLTWLSGQQVVVGRASTRVGAPLVRLGWGSEPHSTVVGAERLSTDDPGSDPIDYIAGTEFRLLGTYNALDAQRVFRFGLALGRRFAQVPVPPASVDDFATMLEAAVDDLANPAIRRRVAQKVLAIYAAHHATTSVRLGPALFLSIPDYVRKGIELADIVDIDPSDHADVDRLVVEAYLLSTGSWLARLDPNTELGDLAMRLAAGLSASSPVALTDDEWHWVAGHLPTIGG